MRLAIACGPMPQAYSCTAVMRFSWWRATHDAARSGSGAPSRASALRICAQTASTDRSRATNCSWRAICDPSARGRRVLCDFSLRRGPGGGISAYTEAPAPPIRPLRGDRLGAEPDDALGHVDRVVDRHDDQRRNVEGQRAVEPRREVLGRRAAPGRHPERLGQLDEVGIAEADVEGAAELLVLLPGDGAELAVLPQDIDHRRAQAGRRLQPLAIHQEAALAA